MPNEQIGEDYLNFKKRVQFVLTFHDQGPREPGEKYNPPDTQFSTNVFDCRSYEWGFVNFPKKSDLNTRKNILRHLFMHLQLDVIATHSFVGEEITTLEAPHPGIVNEGQTCYYNCLL